MASSPDKSELRPPALPGAARGASPLEARLAAQSHDSPLWIEGPQACGKTRLVAEWLMASGRPVLWLDLHETDADPAEFVARLADSAESLRPDSCRLPRLEPEHRLDLEAFAGQFLAALCACLSPGTVIVLDDLHSAARGALPKLLCALLQEHPPGAIQWVALTRPLQDNGPLTGVSRLHRGYVGTEDFLAHAPDSAHIAALKDALSDPSKLPQVLDVLLAESPAEARTLLMETAWLGHISVDGVHALTDRNDTADTLHHLCQLGLLNPCPGRGRGYRCQTDLRNHLRTEGRRFLGPDAWTRLVQRAARHEEASGNLVGALAAYGEACQVDDVCRILREHAVGLLCQGRHGLLAHWLGWIPASRLTHEPALATCRAACLALVSPTDALSAYERAHDLARRSGDTAWQLQATVGAVESLAPISPDYLSWDLWIGRLAHILSGEPHLPGMTGIRAWYAMLLLCLYREPGHLLTAAAARHLADRMDEVPRTSSYWVRMLAILLAYAHFHADEPLAERVLPHLEPLATQPSVAPFPRTWATVWLAVYHYFLGHHDTALRWSTMARDTAASYGFRLLHAPMSCFRIQSLAWLGHTREAFEDIARLRPEIDGDHPYACAHFASVIALTAYRAGDLPRALETAQEAHRLWRRTGFPVGEATWLLTQAIYLLEADRHVQASDVIQRAHQLVAGTAVSYLDALILALQAEVSRRLGDTALATARIAEALSLCSNRKRAAPLLWARGMLPPLLALAFESGQHTSTAASLVSQWRLEPPDPATQHWPWPVQVRILGAFVLEVNGKPPARTRKTQRRLLELVKYIAAAGRAGADLHELIQVFWPGADHEVAQGNFRTAMFRLRRLLGDNTAVEVRQARVRFNPLRSWVDTVALEQALNLPDSLDARRRVAALYRGPLLPGEDEPWMVQQRHRWHAMTTGRLPAAGGHEVAPPRLRRPV